MFYGCDISEVNNRIGFPVDWFKQWQFVGIRVFNEWGRLDTAFHTNWSNCKQAGVPRLAYGWPISNHNNTNLGQQLVSLTPDSEAGWWADYEHSDAGLASVSELEDYIRACNGGFYSNLSELPRSTYLDSRSWWFANPSNNEAPRHFLIEQTGIQNGIDVDATFFDIGGELTPDEHKWLQSIYIRLGGDAGMGTPPNVFTTVEKVVKDNCTGGSGAPAPGKGVIHLDGTFESQ